MSSTPKLSRLVWGTLQFDSICSVSIRTTRSQDQWNNDTWTFLVLKRGNKLQLIHMRHVTTALNEHKLTSGITNQQQGKRFVSIQSVDLIESSRIESRANLVQIDLWQGKWFVSLWSNQLESTTFSTHPQSPDQLYFQSLMQIDFWHVESTTEGIQHVD